MVKAPLVIKLKRGREMCRRYARLLNYNSHALISVKKNWESSASPSTFVCANTISLQMEGTSSSPTRKLMWQRYTCMMG